MFDARKIPIETVCQRFGQLSKRQKQVADLVAAGYGNKQIAHALGISERTVEVHTAKIREIMGVQKALQLAILTYRAQEHLYGENSDNW